SFPDLADQPDVAAGADQPGREPAPGLDEGAHPPRFRLLPPRHPHPEGGRLRELPRPRRPDAPDVESGAADHGMVPGLPSEAGAPPPRQEPDLQHGLCALGARTASDRARARTAEPYRGGSVDQL